MCGLAATPELDVWQVSMRSQLEHGCQSGKCISHLVFLSGNVVEGDIIEEFGQFHDVSLVGYQLMIPSLPFPSQLVNYQG